jgi:hypothetical protein
MSNTETTPQPATSHKKQENGFINIFINVLIPVLILDKLTQKMGALPALILALAFPLSYGIYDFYRQKKINMFSTLGLINISVTGTLALLGLGGIWFAIKEAAFPVLVGVFVYASSFTENPFIKTMFLNPQLMDLDKIDASLKDKSNEGAFIKHLQFCTQLLSLSFAFSAVANFYIAIRIFLPIDPLLEKSAQAALLNEQIAKMTSAGFAVIMVPSIVFMIFILWYFMKGIHKLTGLESQDYMKS